MNKTEIITKAIDDLNKAGIKASLSIMWSNGSNMLVIMLPDTKREEIIGDCNSMQNAVQCNQ